DNRVYTILRTHDDTLWVATWGGGLFAVDAEGSRHSFSYNEGAGELAHNVVYSLYQDSRQNLWIGTNGAGVHSVNPNKRDFRFPGISQLPRGRVQALHRDRTNRLWIGIYGGGLVAVDQGESLDTVAPLDTVATDDDAKPREDSTHYYRHDPEDEFSLANDIVNRIYESPDGQLYISSQGGVQRYRPESDDFEQWGRDFYSDAPLPDDIVYSVKQDHEGRFWIGTYNSGVFRYDPQSGEQVLFRYDSEAPGSLSDNLVYDILPLENGSTWIATNNGLCRHDEGDVELQCYQHDRANPTGLSSSAIRTLFQDRLGRLWIGSSSGGLSRYHADTDTFSHITERDGLSDNTLVAILEDTFGRLWLATGRGISLYHPEDTHVQALGEQSGLPVIEYNYGRLLDTDGAIVFTGLEGLVRIPAEFRVADSQVPQLHITNVYTYTDEQRSSTPSYNDRTIELPLGVRTISLSFAALNYGAPAAYRYRYRLAGFNDDWVSSGEHGTVSYAALPSGTFRFQVEAIHSVNGTRRSFTEAVIVVPEYWWRTVPARIGYVLAGLLVLFAAIRLREHRVLLSANTELEFEQHFFSEIERARREGLPITLLLLDIDYFKNYNDHNGHIAGDHCLQEVSRVLKSVVRRPGDFAARYGGEELLVVLPNTNEQGAAKIAESVQDYIRSSTPVTASIGLAVIVPDRDIDIAAFVERADLALYQAKNEGRDCTRIWRPTTSTTP
ncbi:MAG: diguanylate cyclase, partial [Spirochaeta sp.]|nr:diguanylate cyclase [Spirochaeta sp.]